MDELMEVITWNQHGIHNCGVVIYSVDNFYDALVEWANTAVGAGFINHGNERILTKVETAEEALLALKGHVRREGIRLDWGGFPG